MQGLFASPNAKKGLDLGAMCSPHFKSLKDLADCSDSTSIVSSSSNHGKSESKKHPSLPKEVTTLLHIPKSHSVIYWMLTGFFFFIPLTLISHACTFIIKITHKLLMILGETSIGDVSQFRHISKAKSMHTFTHQWRQTRNISWSGFRNFFLYKTKKSHEFLKIQIVFFYHLFKEFFCFQSLQMT